MLKPFKYQAVTIDREDHVFISKSSESKFSITKLYSTHWLNEALGFGEHLVLCGNAWDVHPINTSDPDNYYKILAESDRGPMVITIQNAVCTQFHIHPKYPSSLRILRNYVNHSMNLIHSRRERLDIPMRSARQQPSSQVLMKGTAGIHNPGEVGQHSVAYTIAKHSGFAFSKRDGPVLVGNNATTANIVKAAGSNVVIGDDQSIESSVYSFDLKGKSKAQSTPRQPVIMKPRRCSTLTQLPKQTLEKEQESVPEQFGWNPQEVRGFLHPGYPVDSMPKVMNLMDTITRSKYVKSPLSPKPNIRIVYKSHTYSTHSRAESWATPTNSSSERRSLALESPNLDPDRQGLSSPKVPFTQDQRIKWVSSQDFKRVFPQTTKSDVKAEFDTARCQTTKHKFRAEEKGKWLAGPFLTACSKYEKNV